MSARGWIAVDLDGTLAHYDRWVSEEHIGAPIPEMIDRVKRWLAEGQEVRIFTARVCRADDPNGQDEYRAVRAAIERWCLKHIGVVLPVTHKKDYQMVELWDDRAVQVEKNTGKPVGYSTRGLA